MSIWFSYDEVALDLERPLTPQACPICGSTFLESKINTGLCFVSKCGECFHEFTSQDEVFSKEVYDELYFEETHKNWFANPQTKLFKKICKLIERHKALTKFGDFDLLDVGCGKGALLKYISTYFPKSNLTGIDLGEPPLDLDPRIIIKKSSFDAFQETGSYDVVVSTAVIEHLSNPKDFLLRIKQFLNSDGLIIIVTVDSTTPLYIAAKIMRMIGAGLPFRRLYDPHHLNHFTKDSLPRLVKDQGFKICFSGGVNVPLKSLDIPSSTLIQEFFYKLGVRNLFFLGSLLGHPFLQILAFKKSE